MPSSGCVPAGAIASLVVIQWWVWCQGVVGRWGWGSGGCSVAGGWVVWVVLRLVWKVRVSGVSRVSVPRAWWWASPRVSVIAWVSSGCGLISTNVAVSGARSRDRLGEAHRVAQVGHPVVGVKGRGLRVQRHGGDHRDGRRRGRQIGQRGPQLGQDRIDDAVMRGHIHLDPAGQPILGGHHRDHRIDLRQVARRSPSGAVRHAPPPTPRDSRRSAPRWRRRPTPAAPSHPHPPTATSTPTAR